MALSAKRRISNDRYIQQHYERLPVSYPKEFCAGVRAAAAEAGESLAGYVKKSIVERMERDGVELPKKEAKEETEGAKP